MTDHQYITIFLDTSIAIDGLWSMFLTLHAAAFGSIFLLHNNLSSRFVVIRASGSIMYGFFAIINGNAMLDYYDLLVAIKQSLILRENFLAESAHLLEYFSDVDYSNRENMVMVVHGSAAVVVLAGLWWPFWWPRAKGAEKNLTQLDQS